MTKFVALLGYPLGHSLSLSFQQAAFDYYHLDIRYQVWETEPAQLEAAVNQLRHPTSLGANVTIPHKERVLPLLDELDKLAIQIGAANVIVNRDGRLLGYNTDAPAFIKALREDGGFEPSNKRVVMLGAGGVARAAGFALVKERVNSLAIINRTFERAEELALSLKGKAGDIKIIALPWSETELGEALSNCDLLVNCTSVGMKHSSMEGQSPLEARFIPKDALVYDLVYNPIETPLLREAKIAGACTLGGLAMLVYQGAASFELWTQMKAPVDIMFMAAKQALKG